MEPTNVRSTQRPAPRRRRIPPWALVLMVMLVSNGVAYAVYLRLKAEPRQADSEEALVSFESQPMGARVLDSGTVLGVTPCSRSFPRLGAAVQKEFRFELAGYEPVTVRARLDSDRIQLQAAFTRSLAPAPVPTATATRAVESAAAEATRAPLIHRPAARRREARPRLVAREPAGVNKLGEEEPAVPKLADEVSTVPKLKDEPRVPKIQDERGKRAVPKLRDDPRVPKLGDEEATVPKIHDDREKTKKLVPKLGDE